MDVGARHDDDSGQPTLDSSTRLEGIVAAVDSFGVAVDRRRPAEELFELLSKVRDQLDFHCNCEQHLSQLSPELLREMREAHARLMREIDMRLEPVRSGRENGLAAHGLLLLWLYHTSFSPIRPSHPEIKAIAGGY